MKVIIGFVTYGELTAKYLPYFLNSLRNQTYGDFRLLAIDNSAEKGNRNLSIIKNDFPEVELEEAGENLGFAKAYNKLLEKAFGTGAEYFFILNPDIILEPEALEKLAGALAGDSKLGSAGPILFRWDFDNKTKTDIVDTCGIGLRPGLRFVDIGQGRQNKDNFSKSEILGPSGAAGLFRISALKRAAVNGCVFDERMFMYKEDCDLAYRLHLAGYKSVCVGQAVGYHDRTAGAAGSGDAKVAINRFGKDKQVKKWSLAGQILIFKKYWRYQNWLGKLAVLWYGFKIVGFVILFEPYLIKDLARIFREKEKIGNSKN